MFCVLFGRARPSKWGPQHTQSLTVRLILGMGWLGLFVLRGPAKVRRAFHLYAAKPTGNLPLLDFTEDDWADAKTPAYTFSFEGAHEKAGFAE